MTLLDGQPLTQDEIDAHRPKPSIEDVLDLVRDELERARERYPAFHSGHEGYAVIQEELDELWADVKAGKGLQQSAQCGAEAIQVAAMALRFLVDLCDLRDVVAYLEGKHLA